MTVPTTNQPPTTHPAPNRAASPAKAIARAAAAAVGLTVAWGILAGATEHHFAYASLLVGLVLARVLTSTTARRPWFPVVAAALAFGVGWFGDVLGIGLDLNWRYHLSSGFLLDHVRDLVDNVSASHDFMDWLFFTLAAVCAAALTASRQVTGADPFTLAARGDHRAADTCPDPTGPRA
jgi:hypothetical protein